MKALILAAGLGTRLRPYTERTPKPLFTIDGRTLLDRVIGQLHRAGFAEVMVNTHHLHRQITGHLADQSHPIPVHCCHEPQILGTGGAVRNQADFWDDDPFMVINCDIVTDIDLGEVYAFHGTHDAPVTLVLTDHPEFNTVAVDADGKVTGFGPATADMRQWTFTGIQVLDPSILDIIPERPFVHSIDVYWDLIAAGNGPKAFMATEYRWVDIGTPDRYRNAAMTATAAQAFRQAYGKLPVGQLGHQQLAGDGSDRAWHRLAADGHTLIMGDHGIRQQAAPTEVDAFVSIGTHLRKKGVPVPAIHRYDLFAGQVFLEDLGDTSLQAYILTAKNPETIQAAYRRVIDILVHMNMAGKDGFDTAWTYQTARYDAPMILDLECRYFFEAFLGGWLNLECQFEDYRREFEHLARGALTHAVSGFMHRDFQSRNIMVRKGRFHLIDFQGGRLGPLQYDLASLLIDPYVRLPMQEQEWLLDYCTEQLASVSPIRPADFRSCYRYCRITRNLQMLGAFGFLSRVKGKTYFDQYIPPALESLKQGLARLDDQALSRLQRLVEIDL